MRFLLVIIVCIGCTMLTTAQHMVDVVEVSWSKSESMSVPDDFSAIQTNTELQLKESYWLKVKVQSLTECEMVLEAGSHYMRGMSYYDVAGNFLFTGNYQEILLKKGVNIFYIHYPFHDFKATNNYTIQFHQRASYYQERFLSHITESVFIAIMLFLFFMSASFYIIGRFRDRLYLYYAWYLGSIVFFFAYQYGFLGTFLPVINQISPAYVWISSASLTISYLFFAQSFLDLKRTDFTVYKIINFGKYFIISIVLVETITYYFGMDIQHSLFYKSIVMIVQIVTMPYILYRCYLPKTTLRWIFIIGALILVFTTLVGQAMSTFRAVSDVNLYIQIGLLIEVFVFSIGIGMRMALINIEKRVTQNKLIDQLNVNEKIQQDFIQELEIKVLERTEELQNRNEEREILLKEIHHRVKNNLQTISSLLNIQQRKLSDPAAIAAIEDSKNRVKVMGLLHKFLYQNEEFEEIHIKPYLEQLMKMLVDSHKTGAEVSAQVSVCNIKIVTDTAINIGLIINELVTNCLKYAVPLGANLLMNLQVSYRDDYLYINVSDNGDSNKSSITQEETGFGWKLVQSLVEKTDGTVSNHYDSGLVVSISIPLPEVKVYANET